MSGDRCDDLAASVTVTVPAGYELVRVGEVPPWMIDAGCRDRLGGGPVIYDDEPCPEDPCTCRRLWMITARGDR